MENKLENITEKAKDYYDTARDRFMSLDNNYKFIALAIVIIIIAVVVYFVRRRYQTAANNKNLFLTTIDQNDPFNARDGKFDYTYNGIITPFIPTDRIPEINTSNTYSFWLFIDPKQWDYKISDWKHILHRGDDLSMQLRNAPPAKYESPGFWITPETNDLVCIISTIQTAQTAQGDAQPANIYEKITLQDIDLNRWIHIAIVIAGDNATLYQDGKMIKNKGFRNAIMINKDNLYIAQMGGFGGNLAYLRFYPSALAPEEVYNIYKTDLNGIKRYIGYEKGNPKTDSYPEIFKFLQCPKCKTGTDSQQQQTTDASSAAQQASSAMQQADTTLQQTEGDTTQYTKQLTGKLGEIKSYLADRQM